MYCAGVLQRVSDMISAGETLLGLVGSGAIVTEIETDLYFFLLQALFKADSPLSLSPPPLSLTRTRAHKIKTSTRARNNPLVLSSVRFHVSKNSKLNGETTSKSARSLFNTQ